MRTSNFKIQKNVRDTAAKNVLPLSQLNVTSRENRDPRRFLQGLI